MGCFRADQLQITSLALWINNSDCIFRHIAQLHKNYWGVYIKFLYRLSCIPGKD